VPCVITGLPSNQGDAQSPFIRSAEWLESFYRPQGKIRSFYAHFPQNPYPARRVGSPMSFGVGQLVTRIIYRPSLFDSVRKQRFILRRNTQYFNEGFRARDRCV
jgi:hypothetical protein